MSLRERFLDALIDGRLGDKGVVSRREFMAFFRGEKETYTGVFLSNSEIQTGQHSRTYRHFTMRVSKGVYRVHSETMSERRRERGLI
jgi:hypothetical protein